MKTGWPSAPASDAMVQLSIRFPVLLDLYIKFWGTGTKVGRARPFFKLNLKYDTPSARSCPAFDAVVQLSIRFAVLLYLYTKFGGTGTNRNKSVNPNYESGEWDFVGIY